MNLSPPTPELPVTSVPETQAYFRDVLGFHIAWHNAEGQIGAVACGDCALFFRETDGPIVPTTCWIFADDLDLAYAGFKEAGADIIAPLADMPWGLRQFTIRDLNGHIFHIHHDL